MTYLEGATSPRIEGKCDSMQSTDSTTSTKKVENPIVSSMMIGLAYGLYRVVGIGAQATINIVAWHVGYELGRRLKLESTEKPGEAIRELAEKLGLADRVEVERSSDTIELRILGCNVCPKRVGGCEIERTACPVPGLVLGFLASLYGVHIQSTTYNEGDRGDMQVQVTVARKHQHQEVKPP